MYRVPFNEPIYLEEHKAILQKALLSKHLSGVGPFTLECEKRLDLLNGSRNSIVTSATHALEMMALLGHIEKDDEVIIPAFTFVSTANAFALREARIRFADVDEYGNLKISEVERLLNSKTKAVVTVHYGGNSAPMDELRAICLKNNVFLFEDAAQSIGSLYKGKALGTIGDLGCYSFHETKNVGSGEGGCLIINNPNFVDRSDVLRQKGTNRKQFMMGLADKYTWVDLGSSYVLSDLNAAYLLPQLEQLSVIQDRRKQVWHKYYESLKSTCEKYGVQILESPSYNTSNHHIFALIFANKNLRDQFILDQKSAGICCTFHYVSLHKSPYGSRYAGNESLPQCERLSDCLVRLPIFYNLTDENQDFVVESTIHWIRKYG